MFTGPRKGNENNRALLHTVFMTVLAARGHPSKLIEKNMEQCQPIAEKKRKTYEYLNWLSTSQDFGYATSPNSVGRGGIPNKTTLLPPSLISPPQGQHTPVSINTGNSEDA